MSADIRGFSYALAPLLQKARWELEREQRKISPVLMRIASLDSELESLAAVRRQIAEQWVAASGLAIDASLARNSVAYLCGLQRQTEALEKQLSTARSQREALQEACLRVQRRIDLLDDHREQSQGVYTNQELAARQVESDRDWIGRSHWKSGLRAQQEPSA